MAKKKSKKGEVKKIEPVPKFDTLPGGVSQKAQFKKKEAAKRRRDAHNVTRLQKPHLDTEGKVKPNHMHAKDQQLKVNPARTFEEKGKAKGIPRLPEDTPEEVIAALKSVATNVPEIPEVPEAPTTDDIEDFVEAHPDLEFLDDAHTKLRSIRTGHMMPSERVEVVKTYVTGSRYALKFQEGDQLVKDQGINLEEDWQPFIVPHKYDKNLLLSVLRGKSIKKTLKGIANELTCKPFQTKLDTYLEGYKGSLTKEYNKISELREKLLTRRLQWVEENGGMQDSEESSGVEIDMDQVEKAKDAPELIEA